MVANDMGGSRTWPTITVVLPAYNESARISQTIDSIARYRAGNPAIRHVVIADDGSTDDTHAVIRASSTRTGLPIEVLSFPHRGKALTIRDAMLDVAPRVDTDFVMMLDADDELRIDQLDRVEWSDDPSTTYIGRRVGSAGGVASTRPTLIRRLMSTTMRVAARLLLGLPFPDTQCGFKLFPRPIVEDLFSQQRATGWTFDAEILYILYGVSRLPIREVPVTWTPRGVSRVRALPAALSGLTMLRTALDRLRGAYRPVDRVRLASGAIHGA